MKLSTTFNMIPNVNVPRLHNDILDSILPLLSVLDLVRLSETTRHLHPIAIHHLMSRVAMRPPARLRQFCEYVLADVPNRVFWLRGLALEALTDPSMKHYRPYEDLYLSAANGLAEVLGRAHRLQCVSLVRFEPLISRDPRIAHILTLLPNLVELRLQNVSRDGFVVLSNMQSKICRLSLSSVIAPATAAHLCLLRLRSLQSLELHDCHEQVPPVGIRLPMFANGRYISVLQWPAMRHLAVVASESSFGRFLQACPNLASFHTEFMSCVPVVQLPNCYHLSVAIDYDQATILSHTYPGGRPQPHFIHRPNTAAAFQRVSPIVLSLRLAVEDHLQIWAELICSLPRLKCLQLSLSSRRPDSLTACMVSKMPQYLSASSLVWIEVGILDLPKPPFNPSLVTKKLLLKEIPAAFAVAVSSLKYISVRFGNTVQTQDETSEQVSWFRSTGSAQKRSAVIPISTVVGEDLAARMRNPACDFSALFPTPANSTAAE